MKVAVGQRWEYKDNLYAPSNFIIEITSVNYRRADCIIVQNLIPHDKRNYNAVNYTYHFFINTSGKMLDNDGPYYYLSGQDIPT
jgi:hypothetical protein